VAEIRPFRGIRYNRELVKDLAAVICPPYDVISPEQQRAYYQRSEHNAIRLEYGVELAQDTPTDNRCTRAAATFEQWLGQSVLQIDAEPAFYIHDHHFSCGGFGKRRRGLMACVRLEPWQSGAIRPHENTVAGIKSDRLALMRACHANFSPILAFYKDRGQEVAGLLAEETKLEPLISFKRDEEAHTLWAISGAEVIREISRLVREQPLYIADGHHRYETALAYRDVRCQDSLLVTGREAFNFIMATLVPLTDPGLIIFPIHRLVRGLSPASLTKLRARLESLFEVELLPLSEFKSLQAEKSSELVFDILGLELRRVMRLRLRRGASAEGIIPESYCEAYRGLAVSLVHHLVLEKLGGGEMVYTPDEGEARQRVEGREYQLAFLLPAISAEAIKAVADAGDRMPGKSTYFYPKLPTGPVINQLEGEL